MALFYKNQGKVEKMSAKTTQSSYRLSDQRNALYGGRGADYDELVYLNGQNADAATVNRKNADAWLKLGTGNGATGSRADQVERDFSQEGSYP
jgi:hypothetical protein